MKLRNINARRNEKKHKCEMRRNKKNEMNSREEIKGRIEIVNGNCLIQQQCYAD
jgi:hypothetical protein